MTEALTKKSSLKPAEQRMTTKEVAAYFRVHPKTIGVWRRKRGLPFKKNRRAVVFIFGDVLRWQAQQES